MFLPCVESFFCLDFSTTKLTSDFSNIPFWILHNSRLYGFDPGVGGKELGGIEPLIEPSFTWAIKAFSSTPEIIFEIDFWSFKGIFLGTRKISLGLGLGKWIIFNF